MKNERGALTVDFIFALTLTGAVSIVLLSLSFTLFVSQVGQYVAFATSRNYFAGHVTKEKQEQMARDKFDQLMTNPNIRRFFGKGWFNLKYDSSDDFSEEYSVASSKDIFTGSRLIFEAKILDLPIPILGTSDGSNGFTTRLNSFIGREPSDQECWQMVRARWRLMQQKKQVPVVDDEKAYVAIADNGC